MSQLTAQLYIYSVISAWRNSQWNNWYDSIVFFLLCVISRRDVFKQYLCLFALTAFRRPTKLSILISLNLLILLILMSLGLKHRFRKPGIDWMTLVPSYVDASAVINADLLDDITTSERCNFKSAKNLPFPNKSAPFSQCAKYHLPFHE